MRELFSADLERLNLEACELVGLIQYEHQQHQASHPEDPPLGVKALYTRLESRGLPVDQFPFRDLVAACRLGWLCGILDWDVQHGRLRRDYTPGAVDIDVWWLGDDSFLPTVATACSRLGLGVQSCPVSLHEAYHYKALVSRVIVLSGPWKVRSPKNIVTMCNLVHRMNVVRRAREIYNTSGFNPLWLPHGVDVRVHEITRELRCNLQSALDQVKSSPESCQRFGVIDDGMLYQRDVDGIARLLLAATDRLNDTRSACAGSTLDGELTGVNITALNVSNLFVHGTRRRRRSLRDSSHTLLAV